MAIRFICYYKLINNKPQLKYEHKKTASFRKMQSDKYQLIRYAV